MLATANTQAMPPEMPGTSEHTRLMEKNKAGTKRVY
jgi:hypothetical protein